MLEKKSHINTLILSTLAFALSLELFFYNPSAVNVILGYVIMLGILVLHYDLHTMDKHPTPFKSAYAKAKKMLAVEKHIFSSVHGLLNRFNHLYKPKNLGYHFQFMIQPTFLYWGVVSLLFFFINPWFSQGLIIVSVFCFLLMLANMSSVYRKKMVVSENHFHILSITKVFVVFVAFFASYGYFYFGYVSPYQTIILVLATSFTLLYNFVWKSGKLFKKEFAWLSVFWSGLLVAIVAWVLVSYHVNLHLAVVSLFATHFFCFGLIKNYLKDDLTKKIFLEYLLGAILFIALVWANSYFDQKIL